MSATPPPSDNAPQDMESAPADLNHAGAVVDKAIEFMTSQNISSLAVASALLGGALGMLTRSLDDEGVISILGRAIDSVRAGEFHGADDDEQTHEPKHEH